MDPPKLKRTQNLISQRSDHMKKGTLFQDFEA